MIIPQQAKVQDLDPSNNQRGSVVTRHMAHRIAAARMWLDRRGVTAVEYGIVAAFLCLSLLAVFAKFGNVLSTMFSKVSTSI